MLDSPDDPDPVLPELELPVELGVEVEESLALGVELEEPLAPGVELEEPLALCSRWHCSSAAPLKPVQSVLEPVVPVDAGSVALPAEGEAPLVEGVVPLDGVVPLGDAAPPEVPLALELSAADDPP